MTSPSLASLIGDLTHSIDRMESVFGSRSGLLSPDDEFATALAMEINCLHTITDGLNLLYEETRDRELDHAFEAVD